MKKMILFKSSTKVLLLTTLVLTGSGVLADSGSKTWTPWYVSAPEALQIAVPPNNDMAENDAIVKRVASLNDAQKSNVYHWPQTNPNYRWMQMALERYAKGPPSPKKGRGLALLNVAIYDAVAISSNAKIKFKRARPEGLMAITAKPQSYSYPSAHAAAAGAAAGVLTYLFPDEKALFQKQAHLAGDARVDGGVNYPSDVTAGLAIGEQVSEKIIEYALNDNSDSKWTGERPTGPDKLQGDLFVYPTTGDWKPWAIVSSGNYLPPPPAPIDSPEMLAQLEELKSIERNVPNSILAWVNHSTWRAYNWWYERVATAVFERGNSIALTETALAYATVSATNHDALIACFKAKYTYWLIRPAQLDPSIPALFPNPPHPSYPAAHSCSSMSYAMSISHFFPEQADKMQKAVVANGDSRLIAGIHYPMDRDAGEILGRAVASDVVKYAEALVGE